MSRLEYYRKRAKQVVRWHRAGYYPVAAMIRSHLPAFQKLDDSKVLAAEFKLRDAQELVARSAGFAGWEALRLGIENMESTPQTAVPRATLIAVEPQLFVFEMQRALDFFTSLGFSLRFTYGEPAFYAQVERDVVRLNLRLVHSMPATSGEDDLLACSVVVDDVKQLYLEFEAGGVQFRQSLRKEPWGSRTFVVSDPDGNLILFAGD